jgi:uncharacterized protein DUF1329
MDLPETLAYATRRERGGYHAVENVLLRELSTAKPTQTWHAQLNCRRMFRALSFISLLILMVGSAFAGSDLKRPLTEKELLQLLSGGVYSRRVAALVGERGLAFSPTRSDLESLRHAGADEFLLKTVAKAPVISIDNRNPQLNKLPSQKKLEVHREPLASSTARTNAQILEVLPSGKITLQNWRQYQQYMPIGMIKLFDGAYFWKMPVDIEIDVGPTVEEEPPAAYLRATEKYSDRVKVVHLSNGHNDVVDYVAGEPFPNPHDPDKGYKLLADLWFAYTPHIAFGGPDNPVNTCTQDRLGNISCVKFSYVYRQTAYNTDPGAFHDHVAGGSVWYTEWLMIEEPEQARYTTQLTLFFKDNQQVEQLYTFVPSLRQTIRGSLASRCSPVAGTDYIQDDYKSVGFNGGIAIFDAKFLAHKKILALAGDYRPLAGDFPNNYSMPLGWPRPSWGKWQLRDVDVISVQRIPAERANYCYGKRIVYEDSQSHYALWEDAYDSSMNLWKIALVAQRQVRSASLGYIFGPVTSSVWDVQADHMTNVTTQNKLGDDMLTDDDVPAEYRDLVAYSTPAGLYGILK